MDRYWVISLAARPVRSSSPFVPRWLRCSVVNSVVFETSCARPPSFVAVDLMTHDR